jgi:demethylmenaquinone methyltransferase / 2-methoxy-6-polyprenyl-1,4-benzoquinol methylase
MNVLRDPALKRAYVRQLFGVVAPRYNVVSSMLSFLRDSAWKKLLVRMLTPPKANCGILDLACGTGDITLLLSAAYPDARIVGCDLAVEMVRIASGRLSAKRNVTLTLQDMGSLGLKDGSVDLVVGGYALRNAPDIRGTIRETARILRTGGSAAFLEFSKSSVPLIAAVQSGLLLLWGGLWGLLLHRRPWVYAYLGRSLSVFPDRKRLLSLFREAGLHSEWTLPRMFGLIRIDITRKKGEEGGRAPDARLP